MQATAGKPRPFTGRHMLAILIAFFGVVIAVNVVLAWFANSTWSGLVVSSDNELTQTFNRDNARARALATLGWKIELTHEPGKLTVTYADKDGRPLAGLTLTGQLRRTTTASQDRPLAFRETTPGTYLADATMAPGLWEVAITANGDGATGYDKTFRLIAK
ncbi:MAG: FixH family protein [Rhizobiales bacterium]|nr:FixH family protein [Hyphomicrobiales bacterium]MBI3673200.1 FixH family protein [Hyphomicrobiales bacterium]